MEIYGYVDSYWARDVDMRISTNGYVFQLLGGVLSWMSERQVVVTLSIIVAQYMEATNMCKEDIQPMKLCLYVGISQRSITIQCDSQSVNCLEKNT